MLPSTSSPDDAHGEPPHWGSELPFHGKKGKKIARIRGAARLDALDELAWSR